MDDLPSIPDYKAIVEDAIRRTEITARVTEELIQQSDRGTAVIGGAYVEDGITELIRAAWRDDEKVQRDVFGHSGPLGTFNAKTKIAYVSWLIGPHTRDDLDIVRGIRNDFAHLLSMNKEPRLQLHKEYRSVSFEQDSIRDRCNQLFFAPNATFQVQGNLFIRPDSPRNKFILTATHLGTTLHHCAEHIQSHGFDQARELLQALLP
jgi:hypothetical protein